MPLVRIDLLEGKSRGNITWAAATLVSTALCLAGLTSLQILMAQPNTAEESVQSKISRDLSAAPPNIAKSAAVAEMDVHGKMKCRGRVQMTLPACRAIQRELDCRRCVKTRWRCSGPATSSSTSQSQRLPSPALNICSPEPRGVVTPTPTIRQALPSESDRIG
jgi:hypothetical protein